jgi:hypothetical protein
MESQHRAVLATVAALVEPESIARRDRSELISACRTLADWLRQYVEIAAEQSVEIQRLTRASEEGATAETSARDAPQGLNSSTP